MEPKPKGKERRHEESPLKVTGSNIKPGKFSEENEI
jgi:hypothetical protein